MYDFSVFYGDFKSKLSVEQFIKELTDLGGYEQDYTVIPFLNGKRISLEKEEEIGISDFKNNTDLWFKIKWIPEHEDIIEIRFYDYHGEAVSFFKKYGVNHNKALKREIDICEAWRKCTGYYRLY